MARYIIRRLWQTLIVLFFVSLFAFLLVRLAPGNPARMMLPDGATEEQVHMMEIKLGLDKSIPVQYWVYITGLFKGDFGTSTTYMAPVLPIILQRLPVTAKIAFGTVFFGALISIVLGVIAGANRGKPIDFIAVAFALVGQSMATPWLAVLFVFIFAIKLGVMPAIGTGSGDQGLYSSGGDECHHDGGRHHAHSALGHGRHPYRGLYYRHLRQRHTQKRG